MNTPKAALVEALKLAVRQNEHDMLMTGEELRQCRAALAQAEAAQPVAEWQARVRPNGSWRRIDPPAGETLLQRVEYLRKLKNSPGGCNVYEVRALYAAPQPAEAAPTAKAERVRGLVNAGPYPGMSEAFDAHMGAACWTDPAWRQDAATWSAAWKAALSAAEAAPKQEAHADDAAVGAFAAAMREKLALARAKGRSGWQTCSPESLSEMLRDHVEKGGPRDVANFCMFLWSLGAGITAPLPGSDAFDRWVNAGMGVRREAALKQEEAVADERTAFDAWFAGFQDVSADFAWEAWQARAALAAQPQQPAPERVADTMANLRLHIECLERELRHCKAFAETVHRHQREQPDVWYWQGDGTDHIESMVHSLPVVIRAEDLRALLASERERLCAAIKAEDDYTVTQGDYMLDSDDCISVIRGTWKRPDFSVDAPTAANPGEKK